MSPFTQPLTITPHEPQPTPGAAFADGETRIATCDFVYPDDEPDDADVRRDEFAEKLSRFLQWLTDGSTVESAGRKAMLVAHLAGKGPHQTDSKLAAKIGISRARVSQLRREIANDFGRFARCNGRRT